MKNKIIDFIKTIVFTLINLFRKSIYMISTISKVKQNKIFVNCFDGKGFGDNPKYIILELLKLNNNVKIYWVCKNNYEQIELENIIYIKPFSIKAIYHQATSKIWISTVRMPYYSIKRNTQIYIQTWHGSLGFKKIEQECENALSSRYIKTAKHDSKMIDYFISSNKDSTNLYKDYFWYSSGNILEYGTPRNDIFFNSNQEFIDKIKLKYKFANKKILLYAPTFRKDNSFKAYNIDYLNLINTLNKKFGEDWIVIVRLHPRLSKNSNNYITYNNKIINGSMISDIQELLLITDFLITDYSSIAFDFMNTNRPIIIYATDIEDYKKDRDFHIKLEDTPFTITRNNIELFEKIECFDTIEYSNKLEKFKNKYGFFDDGQSSLKVAQLINNYITQKLK